MAITKRPDFSKLLQGITPDRLGAIVKRAADQISAHIRIRTRKGLDINNEPFASYSDQYQNRKASIMTERGDPDNVNLTLSGKMLNSIQVKGDGGSSPQAWIYFSEGDRQSVAYYHQYGLGQPRRRFFGLNSADEARYMSYVQTEISKGMGL